MNILFLTTHLNTGGISSYLLTLTKGLISRGHQVHIVSSGGDMENIFLSLGAHLNKQNIRTKSELDPRIYQALEPLKSYIQKNHIDLIHAHTRITQVMGCFLKKKTGVPYVATCHGFFKPKLSRKLFPCWGDATIAISQAVVDHLVKDFSVAINKIHRVESGIDLERFLSLNHEDRNHARKQYALGNEPLIGMIARLSDVKGQDILLNAMPKVVTKVPEVKLLLVGEGKLEGMLKTMVRSLRLEQQVVFLPVVNKTSEILPMFDVYVNPSRQEGLGLSIMEAQAAGLPVVASNIGGIPTLISDQETGLLVEAENSDQLADAIIQVLSDRPLAEKIAAKGRKFIEEHYSAEQMIHKTMQVYQSLL